MVESASCLCLACSVMIEYMFLEEDGETQYWLGGTILRGMGSKKSAKDWWTVAFEDDSNLGVSSSHLALSSCSLTGLLGPLR